MNNQHEITRNHQQYIAMTALYDVLTYLAMGEEIDVEQIITSLTNCSYNDSPIYIKEIVLKTISHLEEEIALLEKNMIKWKFFRLNRVEQAILLLSLTHYFYVDTTIEKNIVINVAINLAKKYLETKDYKFVNAILDKVLIRE